MIKALRQPFVGYRLQSARAAASQWSISDRLEPFSLSVSGHRARISERPPLARDYLRSRATVQLFGPVVAAVVPIMRSPSTRAVYEVPPAENVSWSPQDFRFRSSWSRQRP